MSCQPGHDYGRRAECNASGHSAVEAAKIEMSRQLGLRGSRPLKHQPVTHEQTVQCSYDRVGHQPCLMREQGDEHCDLRTGSREILANRTCMTSLGDSEA